MALWGVGIAARLFFLQIVESAYYIEKAQQQQQQTVLTAPRRGDILDRDGNVLARSVQVDSVFARPPAIKDIRATARTLSRLTGIPVQDLVQKLDPDSPWVWVKRKISEEEKDAIQRANLPGIGFQKEFRRYYPERKLASHLLGYVDVDEKGKTGLEGSYNVPVLGQPGQILVYRDARGNIYQREQPMPQAGSTLTTTIDRTIQYIIEKELAAAAAKTQAAAISIVAMDPNSGAILGMANFPTFNPNEYADAPPSTWINHSLSLTYEPGSTFKMVTIAAALEEGLTTPDEKIYCEDGAIVVYGRRIRDHNPYGILSVREIMQNSSNVGTIKLALRVGEDRLKSYIDKYGFGKKTSVDLPAEVGGLVRPTSQWTKTSIASIAIGQEISVTPLQIATMVSTVANGGTRYTPYVVQKIQNPLGGTTEIPPRGSRVMSPETAQHLREMLEDVVTDGTAKTSKLEGYRAGGKTGTAQKIDPVTRRYSSSKYVASFAGFAPVSDPRIALVVVVDEPKGQYYGGEVAAPVFKRIVEQVLQMKSVVPDVPQAPPHFAVTPEKAKPQPAPKAVPVVPEVRILDASLTSPGRVDTTVLELGEIVVPNFIGQPLRQASDESDRLGLEAITYGSGKVVGQSPPPGAHVRPGSVIRFQLSLK